MGLEELRAEILRRTSEEVRRLEADAKAAEARILAVAEEERKLALEGARAEAAQAARDERNERLAAARLNAMRMRSEAKEEALERAFAKVLAEFEGIRESGSYPALLKALIEQGVGEIGPGAEVQVSEDDLRLAKKWGFRLSEDAAGIGGGAVISSKDGRVKIRNTLREVFDQHRDLVRKEVYEAMFGEEEAAREAEEEFKGAVSRKGKNAAETAQEGEEPAAAEAPRATEGEK